MVFVAVPAAAVGRGGAPACSATTGRPADAVVTDVSGVKTAIVEEADHPRFIGGHPMAGSEQTGLHGADPDLFVGAVWVLTPTATTDLEAFNRLKGVVMSLGADVLVLSAGRPRPAGGRGVARAAPRRGHADERGHRRGRAGRHAAAAGRRRLPRHDPGRRRPSRHLARHLRRERDGHRRRRSTRW